MDSAQTSTEELPSLTFNQIQENCFYLWGYSHSNLYLNPENEGQLKGFTNLNVPAKLLSASISWWTKLDRAQMLEKVIVKTLDGIIEILQSETDGCPVHFFMITSAVDKYLHGPRDITYLGITVTYRQLMMRLRKSNTLGDCQMIQDKVNQVIDVYDSHPMGSQLVGLPASYTENITPALQAKIRERILVGIFEELDCKYNEARKKASLEPHGTTLPPSDFTNITEMRSFLASKVKQVMDEVVAGKLWDHTTVSFKQLFD